MRLLMPEQHPFPLLCYQSQPRPDLFHSGSRPWPFYRSATQRPLLLVSLFCACVIPPVLGSSLSLCLICSILLHVMIFGTNRALYFAIHHLRAPFLPSPSRGRKERQLPARRGKRRFSA